MADMELIERLRQEIMDKVVQYHEAAFSPVPFVPDESPVPVSGKIVSAQDLQNGVSAVLEGHWTLGPWTRKFEESLAKQFGTRFAVFCNSGSSANLLALSALELEPGSEVITVAAGFPTTVNPIIQCGCVPVFLDVTMPTYGVDISQLKEAFSSKTRAVVIAHTLGNPFDLTAIVQFCFDRGLYLIEDACDSMGSTYDGWHVGQFGDLATCSFYPAHHICSGGEGGAVFTDDPKLKILVESYRDWGRACWCAPGVDNTCGKRFGWQLGKLPLGFDHKYCYTHIGYNLKATDMQAAIGCSQITNVETWGKIRRRNFSLLSAGLRGIENLILPEATSFSDPDWFGFPITVKHDAPFCREDLTRFLESRKIGTRPLFGGNLQFQPAFQNVQYRRVESMDTTDLIAHASFWVGVWPGLTEEMIGYVVESIQEFCRER